MVVRTRCRFPTLLAWWICASCSPGDGSPASGDDPPSDNGTDGSVDGAGGRMAMEKSDGGENTTSGDGGENTTSGDGGENTTSGDGGENNASGGEPGEESGGSGGTPATGGEQNGSGGSPPTIHGCVNFVDRTSPEADRTLIWNFDITSSEERCMRITAGQTVSFSGNFTMHPVAGFGGDSPNPITTDYPDSGPHVIVFASPGLFGFMCDSHTEMQGAIYVLP